MTKTYVEWAVKNEFAVIDVNIPKHTTDFEVGLVEFVRHLRKELY